MADSKEIELNGVTYVPKDSVASRAENVDGLPYVVIRTYSAGVHVGYLKHMDGMNVTLANSRRIYRWSGAFTLSEMANHGVDTSNDYTKIAEALGEIILTQAIEIIYASEEARKLIEGAKAYDPDND